MCMCVGWCCLGIFVLVEVVKCKMLNLCVADLGFVVGFRLNVAGWFIDMSKGIDCFMEDDLVKVKVLVIILD